MLKIILGRRDTGALKLSKFRIEVKIYASQLFRGLLNFLEGEFFNSPKSKFSIVYKKVLVSWYVKLHFFANTYVPIVPSTYLFNTYISRNMILGRGRVPVIVRIQFSGMGSSVQSQSFSGIIIN